MNTTTKMECMHQQMDEFECVLSMFPEDGELEYDAQLKEAYVRYLSIPNIAAIEPPPPRFEYFIRFKSLAIGTQVPELEIKYPSEYPVTSPVEFVVHCASLSRRHMERLQTELLCISTGNQGEPVVLQLYQCMADILAEAVAESQEEEASVLDATPIQSPMPSLPLLLGRRAIYFHHIIASTKRRVVKEWALELGLGGFSKIGWPGVVIVEGDERCVQEYVRRLQHLRWKQMVVRGEQTERVVAPEGTVDALRRLPSGFCEFPETQMSEAAALCRAAGIEELFLSVMKIYRPATDDGKREQQDTEAKKTKTTRR